MSQSSHKLPIAHAQKLANRLVAILSPHCERIDIAGSIRREKEYVGDIEIVCAPTLIPADLFGTEKMPIPEFWEVLGIFPKLMGREDRKGRYYKYRIPTGWDKPDFIQLDLFIPQPHDYFRQLAIRTGSSNYSGTVIAQGWRKIGWVGTYDGLRREEEVVKRGEEWVCIDPNPTLPPVWESEEAFFQWLGVEYIPPQNRN